MSLSKEQEALIRQLAKEHNLLPPDGNGDGKRPEVKLPADDREVHDLAREIGEIAVKTSLLFRRDQMPVTVNADKRRLDAMSAQKFRTWISRYVACYREKRVGDDLVRKFRTMNLDTAHAVLESEDFWKQLPEVKRLNPMRLPVIRQDGCLDLLQPGYFAEQGIYTLDGGPDYDETMTLDQGKAALDELLKYFPFRDPRSKSACLAGMFTLWGATMLGRGVTRPAFIYTANTTGAGKTLAAKLAIIPVVGSCAPRSLPRKEEAKKVLDVAALQAAIYILFDNIRGKIQGEEIESFVTSAEWEGRPLGESSIFRVDNVATMYLTGNQSTTSQDMADRSLFVELFVEEADNRDREIPRDHVIDDAYLSLLETRSRICSALWACAKAWDADARKPAPAVMPRFEGWSAIIPAIISFAGYADCTERPPMAGVYDELEGMRTLVQVLAPAPDAPDPSENDFDDLIATIKKHGLFEDVEVRGTRRDSDLFETDGKASPAGRALFGRLFARYDHRLFRFAEPARRLRFIIAGKGDDRRFVIRDE